MIRSELKTPDEAPMQGSEGAPDAWIEIAEWAAEALDGLREGEELLIITWLHAARRDVLRVHPRSDPKTPLTGVFATRSPDRPNPLGLHPVVLRAISGNRLYVGPIEAIDGTPVVDIKPVLSLLGGHAAYGRDTRRFTPFGLGARGPRVRSRACHALS